ncbi:MAG: carbon-nitrogen hydrolase family protein [Deltaproteobacteria bacterium]|nr:carbon-nitrogen hydrolase family protein [Deltaproteobacteria bacterium]
MSPLVKIILIQPLPVSFLDSPENVDRALKLLEGCRGRQADLICFPEYFPFSGDEALAQAAKDLKAYLVAGLVEESKGRRYNTATLFDRSGNLVGRQRKCTLGNLERKGFGVTPGAGFQVFDTDFGRLGMAVCIDFWGQPEAARQLTDQGADLVVNPSIFPILRGHWSLGALVRAFDNYLPVVGVNTSSFVSEIAGRHYPMHGGGSFAIQPPGPEDGAELSRLVRNWDDLSDWVILKAGEEEQLLTIHLNLAGPRLWRPVIWERFGIQR